ncbi:MAG: HAMP domain-containing sensor histidine kinase [Thermoleophilia bacterium]|jgi:histidine kinase
MFKKIPIKWKLLFTYLVVVAVCLGVVIIVTRQLTISAYSDHVHMMQGEGMMGNRVSGNMASDLIDAFRDALNVSLLWAGLIAVAVAFVISIVISRKITRPIHDMAMVTERIADGDYAQKVDIKSNDEIGSLAHSLNEMTERLAESQKLKRELMANIAHELRTPLTSISGYMEGLEDGIVPASRETYELVHREAARLSRLVDDLQRLSRAESGQEVLDVVELPSALFIERVVKKLRPMFIEKGISLDLELAPELPPMLVDEDKTDQVLVNLIDNALNYTSPGGKVTLSARASGRMVQIEIADTGIGISAEDLPYIFERFYRADKSRSRDRGGSGIGLTIAKKYIESLGGDISVKSAPGQGTIFKIILPAAA